MEQPERDCAAVWILQEGFGESYGKTARNITMARAFLRAEHLSARTAE